MVVQDGHVELVAENTIAPGESVFRSLSASSTLLSSPSHVSFSISSPTKFNIQLLINDGLIGNRELLDWYGFVIPFNRNDYYPVGVGLKHDDNFYL